MEKNDGSKQMADVSGVTITPVVQENIKMAIDPGVKNAYSQMVMEQYLTLMSQMFGPMGNMGISLFGIPLIDPPKPKPRYDERVKFSFYGLTGISKGHGGIITTAAIVNAPRGVVHYGVAFCSPNDAYDKHKGKEIAFRDLEENMTTVALAGKRHHAVHAQVFADIISSKSYPSWAKLRVMKLAIHHIEQSMRKRGDRK